MVSRSSSVTTTDLPYQATAFSQASCRFTTAIRSLKTAETLPPYKRLARCLSIFRSSACTERLTFFVTPVRLLIVLRTIVHDGSTGYRRTTDSIFIDDAGPARAPVLSPDGRTLYFFRGAGGPGEILTSTRGSDTEAGGTPIAAGALFTEGTTNAVTWIAADGKSIVFSSNRLGKLDIYRTRFDGGAWTTSEALASLDSVRDDYAVLTPDELQAFVASDRIGDGGLDLYYTPRASTSDPFPPPVALEGVNLNTPQPEIVTYVSADGCRSTSSERRRRSVSTRSTSPSDRSDPLRAREAHAPGGTSGDSQVTVARGIAVLRSSRTSFSSAPANARCPRLGASSSRSRALRDRASTTPTACENAWLAFGLAFADVATRESEVSEGG